MTIAQALILAIVQGLTEFIPVSSSAHLALVPWALDWGKPNVAFDVMLHFGTLLSLVAYFRSDIGPLLAGLGRGAVALPTRTGRARLRDDTTARLALLLVAGCIPTAILGFTLHDQFEGLFDRPSWIAAFLIVTGIWLVMAQRLQAGRKQSEDTRLPDALWVGLAQGIAIAPGISRSGATIGAALLTGMSRPFAPRFAFLLSIPAILGAAVAKLPEVLGEGAGQEVGAGPLALGVTAAAVSGYLAIILVMRMVREGRLDRFAYYCWAVAAAVLIALAAGR